MPPKHRPTLPPRSGRIVLAAVLALALLTACRPAGTSDLRGQIDFESPALSISAEETPLPGETLPTEQAEAAAEAEFEESNEQFLLLEELIIGLLFLAVLVGIVAHRLRVPYTVGLVLIGLVLTLSVQLNVRVAPNLILALLVPPLIFEAAFHLNFNHLRENLVPILVLAVPGVILTTLLVSGIVAWGTGLALPLALVFGALVSATDPVSVVALFRTMGVPRRLIVLLEGESLFNDGTAIVVYDLVLALALSGLASFNLAYSLLDFARVAGGGLVVGLVLGGVVSQMISRIDDYLIETTLTSVLAYGAYLVAEVLGVSGVLAVVAAGLINGNIGPRGMSPTTRIVVYNFWEYAGFLANSFIFLLIGLRIDLAVLYGNWPLILWAIGAVLLARAIGVYGLSQIERDIPIKWRHVLYWGGLRGAISLALALSLPGDLEGAHQVQVMAFGVVIFTLLAQGFSMAPLVRRLGLVERGPAQQEYERRHARAVASRVAYEHLERRHRQGLISDHSWSTLAPLLQGHTRSLAAAVKDVITSNLDLEAEELDTARRESLRAQRSALTRLFRDGVISEEIYAQLASEVDAALTESQLGWPELIGQAVSPHGPVNRLMAAIVQQQDVESAISSLTKLGVVITCLPSTGAYLSKRNTTLLIGLMQGQEEAVVRALSNSCRQRVEYLAQLLVEYPSFMPEPVPVTVGGATIFVIEIERFEAF